MSDDMKDLLIVLAAAAGTFIAWRVWAAGGDVAEAVNPTNPDNVVNRGADRVLKDAGVVDEGSSLGSTLYDWLNPGDEPQLRYPAPIDGENGVFH